MGTPTKKEKKSKIDKLLSPDYVCPFRTKNDIEGVLIPSSKKPVRVRKPSWFSTFYGGLGAMTDTEIRRLPNTLTRFQSIILNRQMDTGYELIWDVRLSGLPHSEVLILECLAIKARVLICLVRYMSQRKRYTLARVSETGCHLSYLFPRKEKFHQLAGFTADQKFTLKQIKRLTVKELCPHTYFSLTTASQPLMTENDELYFREFSFEFDTRYLDKTLSFPDWKIIQILLHRAMVLACLSAHLKPELRLNLKLSNLTHLCSSDERLERFYLW